MITESVIQRFVNITQQAIQEYVLDVNVPSEIFRHYQFDNNSITLGKYTLEVEHINLQDKHVKKIFSISNRDGVLYSNILSGEIAVGILNRLGLSFDTGTIKKLLVLDNRYSHIYNDMLQFEFIANNVDCSSDYRKVAQDRFRESYAKMKYLTSTIKSMAALPYIKLNKKGKQHVY